MTPRWEPAPYAKGQSVVADVDGQRLYVRRAAKGSRQFNGYIGGQFVGTWDSMEKAQGETFKKLLEQEGLR